LSQPVSHSTRFSLSSRRRVHLPQPCRPPVHRSRQSAHPFDARWRVVARTRLSTDLLRIGTHTLCELYGLYSLLQCSGEALFSQLLRLLRSLRRPIARLNEPPLSLQL